MAKEIYISSTPHETRLALVEDDQLAEIYYERENEYTLAGSIYKGRVTRVLPGMQSAFVDVGLERDAFLYVTDFIEETEEGDDIITLPQGQAALTEGTPRNERNESRSNHRNENRNAPRPAQQEATPAADGDVETSERGQGERSPAEPGQGEPGQQDAVGARRWRGRRGRRRGGNDRNPDRGQNRQQTPAVTDAPETSPNAFAESASESFSEISIPEEASPAAAEYPQESRFSSRRSSGRSGGRPQRRGRRNSDAPEEPRSHSYETPRAVYDRSTGSNADIPPIILPGESLSKYRRGSKPAPAASTPAASPSAGTAPVPSAFTAKPSTLIEAPLSWDGGLQLPGESLARHRNPAPAKSAAPAPAPVVERIAEAHVAPESFHTEATSGITLPVITELSIVAEIPMAAEPPAVAAEYEPTEASASYLVDPTTPSAYRQSSVIEPEAEPEAKLENAIQNIQEEIVQHDAPAIAEETAIRPSDTIAPNTIASSDEDDENASEADLRAFAPGTGVLEEELIDEDEDEIPAAYALLDEAELDELIEETLDVQMDADLLGEIVRDAYVEKRTRFQEDANGNGANGHASEDTEEDIEEEFDTTVTGATSSEIDEEEAEMDEEDFASDESSDELLDESMDDAIAEDGAEENGAAAGQTARPSRSRDRGRGRQQGNRRTGRGGPGSGGRGRRATAQTSNLPAITELLKSGQEILVQIAKEPIARKGARITSHIALPGRFLVFMPTVNHVGVSRKIASDEERQRLKRILISEKGDAGGGFIVRTAAATASEEDLRADIRFLLNLWTDIRQRSESCKPPALIYHDLSLVERVLRDQVSENFSTIWVDTEADYERVLRFLQRFQPSLIRRVKLYTKETPLFEQFGIQEEINKALRSKVWLKSGGSIVINQTEALVAIDINTGKYVGKTARLEDTILKTNLDAIPEIVRQIRLRDLGGIIVIDFIDMDERKNRNRVMQVLEEELKSDRAPSKVLQFNDFGLVAITRKRVKQSLERTLSTQCNICTGTGMVKSPITVCNEIFIELRKMHRHLERPDILLRVHPEVVKQLKSNNGHWLSELEELSGKTIIVKSDPSLHPEQFDIH